MATELWTDGSCPANPGHGAWAAILVHEKSDGSRVHKGLGAGVKDTTNNAMELTAVIEGLRALKRSCEVTVYTDSQYVMHGFTKGWIERWKRNGWRNASRKPVANPELWIQLDTEVKRHRVHWKHVRGHRGIPLNERADKLAASLVPMSSRQEKLLADLDHEFDRAWTASAP